MRYLDDDDDEEEVEGTGILAYSIVPAPVAQHSVLAVLRGNHHGRFIPVRGQLVVGRAPELSLPLQDEGVSRRHSRFYSRGGMLWLEDLGSTNGTLLNGQTVHDAVPLNDGDRVQIGGCLLLKLTLPDGGLDALQRQIYRWAVLDAELGVHHRHVLEERAHDELIYAQRRRHSLTLLVVAFHLPAGLVDRGRVHIIRSLAQVLRDVVRTEDLIARFAENELAVLCRSTSRPEAAEIAKRLVAGVAASRFEFESRPVHVRISVGISWGPAPNRDTVEGLLGGARAAVDAACARRIRCRRAGVSIGPARTLARTAHEDIANRVRGMLSSSRVAPIRLEQPVVAQLRTVASQLRGRASSSSPAAPIPPACPQPAVACWVNAT